MMFETSSDDLFLPPYHEEMVDNLLSNEDSDGDDNGGPSLAEALLPLVESSSSPLIPWVCSTRYKTELCTSYAASGLCKYADRCQFAHGLHELHVPYRHPKYKTELCRSYHTTGYCYYGTRCLFVHSPTEQRPAGRRRRKNIPCRTFCSFGVCPFGTRCNFLHVDEPAGGAADSPGSGSGSISGAEEKTTSADHPSPMIQTQAREWKQRGALCRTFSAFGFCLYGMRCRFQHSLPSKLKASESSLSPVSLQPVTGSRASSQSSTDTLLSPFPSALSPLSLFPSAMSPFTMSPFPSTLSPFPSALSPASSSSPPQSSASTSPLGTPPAKAAAHNAFTFSSQHLSDLVLPLAFHLQQLERSQALASSAQKIWDNRAL
ncbi:hypothetical protein CRUP_028185 [Coryphaenoides rupestris]|nr:hypothetical protein CRUP_028185 [Coryphaenoides rupestris]